MDIKEIKQISFLSSKRDNYLYCTVCIRLKDAKEIQFDLKTHNPYSYCAYTNLLYEALWKLNINYPSSKEKIKDLLELIERLKSWGFILQEHFKNPYAEHEVLFFRLIE